MIITQEEADRVRDWAALISDLVGGRPINTEVGWKVALDLIAEWAGSGERVAVRLANVRAITLAVGDPREFLAEVDG